MTAATENEWALITGATGGLGRVFAELAAKAGYDLILSDLEDAPLEAMAREVSGKYGVTVVPIPADLARKGAAGALWVNATDGRDIAVLVNNAGHGRHGQVGANGARGIAWDAEVVTVNVSSLTDLMGHALASMRVRGAGRVLNVASIAAWIPGPNIATYHASKSFVLSLSRAVAEELKGTGVTVTALCPGPVDTGFWEKAGAGDVTLLKILRPMPVRDVANAGWAAMMQGRREVIPGFMNRTAVVVSRLAPTGMVTRLSRLMWQSDDSSGAENGQGER